MLNSDGDQFTTDNMDADCPLRDYSYRLRVRKATVTRYFVLGKGHAREIDAYRALAKSELNSLVWKEMRQTQAYDRDDFTKARREALARLFPLPCSRQNTSNLDGTRHGRGRGDDPRYYCWGCRYEWLNAKARELMDEAHRADDEGQRKEN